VHSVGNKAHRNWFSVKISYFSIFFVYTYSCMTAGLCQQSVVISYWCQACLLANDLWCKLHVTTNFVCYNRCVSLFLNLLWIELTNYFIFWLQFIVFVSVLVLYPESHGTSTGKQFCLNFWLQFIFHYNGWTKEDEVFFVQEKYELLAQVTAGKETCCTGCQIGIVLWTLNTTLKYRKDTK